MELLFIVSRPKIEYDPNHQHKSIGNALHKRDRGVTWCKTRRKKLCFFLSPLSSLTGEPNMTKRHLFQQKVKQTTSKIGLSLYLTFLHTREGISHLLPKRTVFWAIPWEKFELYAWEKLQNYGKEIDWFIPFSDKRISWRNKNLTLILRKHASIVLLLATIDNWGKFHKLQSNLSSFY